MAIKKITLPDNTTQDIQDSRIPGVDSTPTSGSSNLVTSGGVYGAIPTKTSDLTNDSGFITGMTILSYGYSTWQDFLAAYNADKVVYCRASSNSNPKTGVQGRMAFMAYLSLNSSGNPTSVEFQYYRSVSSHTATQQGDQVYIYGLTSAGVWSVTVREAMSKIAAGTGLSSSYASGTLTLNATAVAATATPLSDGTAAVGTSTKYAREDHVHPSDSSKANDSAVVHKTGAETIGGNKTFTGTTQVEDVHNDTVSGFGWITDCDGESIQDALDGKEVTTNKVTSLSSSSTNTQYPSAKCVYDLIGDVETLINAL